MKNLVSKINFYGLNLTSVSPVNVTETIEVRHIRQCQLMLDAGYWKCEGWLAYLE